MTSAHQKNNFIDRIKDRIEGFFNRLSTNRRVRVGLFFLFSVLAVYMVIVLIEGTLNINHWSIHWQIIFKTIWMYVVILTFFGVVSEAITIRALLNVLFLPIESLINTLQEIWQWLNDLWEMVKKKFNELQKIIVIGVFLLLTTIFIIAFTVAISTGATPVAAFVEALALVGVVAAGLWIAYSIYYGDFKEFINSVLSKLKEILMWLKDLPSTLLNALKAYILKWLKTLSDSDVIQSLILLISLALFCYGAFSFISLSFFIDSWPFILKYIWILGIFTPVLLTATVLIITWNKPILSLEVLLRILFSPFYLVILPYEKFMKWLADLIPVFAKEASSANSKVV